jgi:uncharacterized protein YndB with AHSA1/START domain
VRLENMIEIDAPAQRVWDVMADVERWPQWTASMTDVARLDSGPFQVGSQARIKQPRFPVLVWTVTQLSEPESFTWQARSPGATTVAVHTLTPLGPGRTRVTLTIEQSGWLNSLLALFATATTRTYLRLEAEGLKRQAERS